VGLLSSDNAVLDAAFQNGLSDPQIWKQETGEVKPGGGGGY